MYSIIGTLKNITFSKNLSYLILENVLGKSSFKNHIFSRQAKLLWALNDFKNDPEGQRSLGLNYLNNVEVKSTKFDASIFDSLKLGTKIVWH